MGQLARIIASSGSTTPIYAERLMVGVTPAMFARFARPGGSVLKANHAAFVFGHLSLYPPRIMDRLSQRRGATELPASYEPLFKNGAECQDDPTATIYPPMEELTKRFFDGYKLALTAIAEADDAVFAQPNPAEGRMRELFPTIGSMLIFYVCGHTQNHLGQISTWRRAMGLPAA